MKQLKIPNLPRLSILFLILLIKYGTDAKLETQATQQVQNSIEEWNDPKLYTESLESLKSKIYLLVSNFKNMLPQQGRTFGAVKRLQMAFLPLFFKLGVIITLLIVLTIMVSKGLFVGGTILFFNISTLFAKFLASKDEHSSSEWHSPHYHHSTQPIVKNIHVHVHQPDGSQHYQHQPYGGYDRISKYPEYYVPTSSSTNMGVDTSSLTLEEKEYISKIINRLPK